MKTDDLVDIALMVRGLRDAREAEGRLPFILGRLRSAVQSVRRIKPGRRRMSSADSTLDWLWRAAADAPLDDGQRAEVLALVSELKGMCGAGGVMTKAECIEAVGCPTGGAPAGSPCYGQRAVHAKRTGKAEALVGWRFPGPNLTVVEQKKQWLQTVAGRKRRGGG
jgi:hypothetical protein